MKKTARQENKIRLLSFGNLDLKLSLYLLDSDLKKYNIKTESLYNLYSKEMDYILNKEDLYDKITLTSTNKLLNCLLLLNKVNKKICYIEYIALMQSDSNHIIKNLLSKIAKRDMIFISYIEDNTSINCNTILEIKLNNTLIASYSSNNPSDSILEIKNSNILDYVNTKITEFDTLLLDAGMFQTSNLCYLKEKISSLYNENKNIKRVIIYPDTVNDNTAELQDLLKHSDFILINSKIEEILFSNRENSLILPIVSSNNRSSSVQIRKPIRLNDSSICNKTTVNSNITLLKYSFGKEIQLIEYENNELSVQKIIKPSLLPNLNVSNSKQYKEYKQILNQKSEFLISCFFSAFLFNFIDNQNYDICLKAGYLLMKRIFDVIKISLELPNNKNFYIIDPNEVTKGLNILSLKEKGFLLDCNNRNSSEIKNYNAFTDKNLNNFFLNNLRMNHLKNAGLIYDLNNSALSKLKLENDLDRLILLEEIKRRSGNESLVHKSPYTFIERKEKFNEAKRINININAKNNDCSSSDHVKYVKIKLKPLNKNK